MARYSPEVRAGMCRGMADAIGPSAKFYLFDGPEPTSLSDPDPGAILAMWSLSNDWAVIGRDGSLAINGTPLTTTALTKGRAKSYRIKDNAGTVTHEQGTVWMKGDDTPPENRDLELDNTDIAEKQAVQIREFVLRAPGV